MGLTHGNGGYMKLFLTLIFLFSTCLSYAAHEEFDKFFDELIKEQEKEVRELRQMRDDFLLRETRDKHNVRDEVNRIQTILRRDFNRVTDWIAGRKVSEVEPKIELKEDKTAYDVKVELPGFPEESVKVSLKDNDLVISAIKEEKKEDVGATKTFSEFEYGEYRRQIHFSQKIDPKSLKVEFSQGLINVHVNKMKI
jgi:HSP20 family protein